MNDSYRDHFGGYVQHPPVKAFCDLSERCFALFHEIVGGHERQSETPREHLSTRMMYISESTSAAIRLNATWALSVPAMALVRTRYEQVVRHSWLMHQPDNVEMVKYIGSYYAKQSKLYYSLDESTKSEFLKMVGKLPEWMDRPPTKEEKSYLERWESMDLFTMVSKRDALLTETVPYRRTRELKDYYTPIYRQFSSATHFDMFGANLVSLHKAPNNTLVLAPDPQWPAILCLYTTLFDLIQCSEVTVIQRGAAPDHWEGLFATWDEYRQRVLGRDERVEDGK